MWKSFMEQLLKNNGNETRFSIFWPSGSSISNLVGAVFSLPFAVGQTLSGCVNSAFGLAIRTGKVIKYGSQTFYHAVLRPVDQKLALFFGGLNRLVLSPISQALVFVFVYSIVKPLGLLAYASKVVAQSLWYLSKRVLVGVLCSKLYQKLYKPYFFRPLLKVARLVNWVCVDLPAQVVTWFFCAALAVVAQGGVRLSDVVSRVVHGVREFSSLAAKQLLALYRAYDTFAIVPIESEAQSSMKMHQDSAELNYVDKGLDCTDSCCSAVPPVNTKLKPV